MEFKYSRSWWWVFLFCAASFVVYFHSMRAKKFALAESLCRLEEMRSERLLALEEKEELLLRIQSESDPAWIERVLMRDLGVVPEGWLKVHFRDCDKIK